MKKFICILLVAFLNCNSINAAEFRWSEIVTNDKKNTTFYLDRKTIFKVGNYQYYWMLSDYIIPFEDTHSTLTHNVVNCRTFENKIITYSAYSKRMGKGEVQLDFIVAEDVPNMSKWEFFSEKTSHVFVLKKISK